jgi:quaternary ammonium compound-resistance protein SugE
VPWLLLTIAGLLEVVWAIAMKRSEGFTKPGASALTIVAMLASFYLLARAMKVLPLGTAYPIWVGIGAVGAAIAGAILFKDRFTLAHAGFVALIVVGIVGLKVMTPSRPAPGPIPESSGEPAPGPGR